MQFIKFPQLSLLTLPRHHNSHTQIFYMEKFHGIENINRVIKCYSLFSKIHDTHGDLSRSAQLSLFKHRLKHWLHQLHAWQPQLFPVDEHDSQLLISQHFLHLERLVEHLYTMTQHLYTLTHLERLVEHLDTMTHLDRLVEHLTQWHTLDTMAHLKRLH